MGFQEPYKVYTAESNIEAHQVVEMLAANGIPAMADEDQSGESLFSFGRISQFHLPIVRVDKSTVQRAAELIAQFEEAKRQRMKYGSEPSQVIAECEECGESTFFPAKLKGSTQECSHCGAYMDVGEIEWDEDVGDEDA